MKKCTECGQRVAVCGQLCYECSERKLAENYHRPIGISDMFDVRHQHSPGGGTNQRGRRTRQPPEDS